MKTTTIFLSLLLTVSVFFSQTTKSIQHDGLTREYIEYVPGIYNGSTSVPIVICLHGLGDNMTNFSGIGMDLVADTANFIVLTPQAVSSAYGTAWNSGASAYGMVLNGNVDDVGFISKLIDTTATLYNIDTNRIYVTGFSMGGFMCHRLAMDLNDRIAAIASVSGTIGASLDNSGATPIPVCHFHGTADGTVSYTNNNYGMDAEPLVNFWIDINNCDTPAVFTALPDNVSDGKTVEKYEYLNGVLGTETTFYKVNNGDHEWLYAPNNDITYTFEIWRFFRKYDNISTSVNNKPLLSQLNIYPNPVNKRLTIDSDRECQISVFSISGECVLKTNEKIIDVSSINSGIFFLQIKTEDNRIENRKIVIN